MSRAELVKRLFISTIGEDCAAEARRAGCGLEIAEFCWAQYIDVDREEHIAHVRELAKGLEVPLEAGWFHAPFAEISPCAIDPRVLALTRERYLQSLETASALGIRRLVIHGGYIPYVYYPQTYVEGSIRFWRELLRELPVDITIALENVMEPDASMLVEIAEGVGDKRLGLCLDLGHANCVVSKSPPMEWIDAMSKHLLHVHIHNNYGAGDLHNSLGDGTVPMEAALDRVTELCPNATFTIENMVCKPSIDWLESRGYLG